MHLLIDHYDSFTFNLVQAIAAQGREVQVRRNDRITLEEILSGPWETICLSPGPCSPRETGITPEVIRKGHGLLPMLGVCLGHQTIAYAFGGRVVRAGRIMHGKTSPIFHDGRTIYEGIAQPLRSRSLPFPDRGGGLPARLPGDKRPQRSGRNHGPAPSGLSAGRSAVSSGVHTDQGGKSLAAKFL
jgi:hypothetical protein